MKRVILALFLSVISMASHALQVNWISHKTTRNGQTINNWFSQGEPTQTGGGVASTATWDWDGTTLTAAGLYSEVATINNYKSTETFTNDQSVNLSINTYTQTATANSYSCIEGTLWPGLGGSGCGGYTFGLNVIDESTTVWGPGLAVNQTLGGDDLYEGPPNFDGPRSVNSVYDGLGLLAWDGTTLVIGSSIPLGTVGGDQFTFTVVPVPVPAAAWLFGSALGILGRWKRRND